MTGNGQIIDPITDMPAAWILTDLIVSKSGSVFVLPGVPACQAGHPGSWLAGQPRRQHVVYQPASRGRLVCPPVAYKVRPVTLLYRYGPPACGS